jgi:membrane-associated phospholipid phosphatase
VLLVAWSRVRLRRHAVRQTICGAMVGVARVMILMT